MATTTIKITSFITEYIIDTNLKICSIGDKSGLFYNSATGEQGFCTYEIAGETIPVSYVCCYTQAGTSKRLYKVPTSGAEHSTPIGVSITAAANAGDGFWLAKNGSKVKIMPETGETVVQGEVAITSTNVAGTVKMSATIPVSDHWDEVGHAAETVAQDTAGLIDIHFN